MKISGVAIGEWNKICVKKNDRKRTIHKILRAYFLGAVSHKYDDGNYIVRYYNINLLVSKDGEVLTVWRDNTRAFYVVTMQRRLQFDGSNIEPKRLIRMCKEKHKNFIKYKVVYKLKELKGNPNVVNS